MNRFNASPGTTLTADLVSKWRIGFTINKLILVALRQTTETNKQKTRTLLCHRSASNESLGAQLTDKSTSLDVLEGFVAHLKINGFPLVSFVQIYGCNHGQSHADHICLAIAWGLDDQRTHSVPTDDIVRKHAYCLSYEDVDKGSLSNFGYNSSETTEFTDFLLHWCQTCTPQAKTCPPADPKRTAGWMKVWKLHKYINCKFSGTKKQTKQRLFPNSPLFYRV